MSPFPPSADGLPLSADFWEQRYQDGTTRWDLGQGAPPFAHLLSGSGAPKPGNTIVLGSGRGHDVLLFARHGFEVVGVDYAPSAIAAATQAATTHALAAQFIQRDIFELLPEYAQQFDYVVEHTCFCAIDPSLRDRYVTLVNGLLKPGGQLLGLFFTHNRPGGPPYGTTPAEIQKRFSRCFTVLSLIPAPDSVESRQNEEHLGIFKKCRQEL